MGPADSLSSRPGKILWIVKCSERFWYFPGSFARASFRLCMPVSFVDDSPLSPSPRFACGKERLPDSLPSSVSWNISWDAFGVSSVSLVREGSAAGWSIPYHLRRAFSQGSVPGCSILHAGAFAARFACGGSGAAVCVVLLFGFSHGAARGLGSRFRFPIRMLSSVPRGCPSLFHNRNEVPR